MLGTVVVVARQIFDHANAGSETGTLLGWSIGVIAMSVINVAIARALGG